MKALTIRAEANGLKVECPVCGGDARLTVTKKLHFNIFCHHCLSQLITRSPTADDHILDAMGSDEVEIAERLIQSKDQELRGVNDE